jgi:hypothetical protein
MAFVPIGLSTRADPILTLPTTHGGNAHACELCSVVDRYPGALVWIWIALNLTHPPSIGTSMGQLPPPEGAKVHAYRGGSNHGLDKRGSRRGHL